MALQLTWRVYELPLKHPFTISRYTVSVQKTVIATISDGVFSGYGEATANPYYDSTVEKLSHSMAKMAPVVAQVGDVSPEAFWKVISPALQDDYFTMCAIDIAYWDYFARKQNRSLRSFWSGGDELLPMTSYTIGIDKPEVMREKMLEFPWPLYKIKLGTADDLHVVEMLRESTDAVFRVDANAAWTAEQTIDFSHRLRTLGVEFIEQPLPAGDHQGMKLVRQASALRVIADESCQREADVAACATEFHGINIKLMKCGGITPALRMIGQARSLGLEVMAGCMTESSIGISALAQLAPLLDYLDADGALLLAQDTADGVTFSEGKIRWADRPGTGAVLRS